ncbi:MAG: shikimate dehydrogenase [Deltaproteobacteria bacterium]|nr:shikimate dehydrogenase [Deltaproteobacteria bacterium]
MSGIRGTTRLAVVMGWPVAHSRSPQMFEAAFAAAGVDARMMPVAVPPEEFATALAGLRAMRMMGASVTVPHKVAALAACDELTDEARAIGAVNCLALEGTRLVGHNTDAGGFADALVAAGLAPPRRAVLLGGGGAARAVAHALTTRGATVDVVARHPDRVAWTRAHPWTFDDLRALLPAAELVVDTTPIGLADTTAQDAFVDELPLDVLDPSAAIATLVYHRPTRLLERATARGHSTVDGRGMLVHQGARAFRIWTTLSPPLEVMQRALDLSL